MKGDIARPDPNNTTDEWWDKYNQERIMNNYPHTVYCTIWENQMPSYPFSTFQVVIQYWFLYPYDDWANDHEGDWEHINVLISSQFPEQAQLEKVQFYFHEYYKEWNYMTMPYSLEVDDNTHVTVYMGGISALPAINIILSHTLFGMNSGASYPKPARWKDVSFDPGGLSSLLSKYFDDIVLGEGPKISWKEIVNNNPNGNYDPGYGVVLLKDANYWDSIEFFDAHPQYSWLKLNIFFGEPSQLPNYHDPKPFPGPWHKPEWRSLGGPYVY